MRIFIEPPYEAQSIKAFEVLREAGVASARTGESISNQAVVLVDLPDLAKALAVFGKAEMRAVLDSDKFEQTRLIWQGPIIFEGD
jgi:inorganic pyrophosphatase/exopolyphosphatase